MDDSDEALARKQIDAPLSRGIERGQQGPRSDTPGVHLGEELANEIRQLLNRRKNIDRALPRFGQAILVSRETASRTDSRLGGVTGARIERNPIEN